MNTQVSALALLLCALSGTARDARFNGLLGRGWKLSYETELSVIGNTVEIAQADGTRIQASSTR